jgi:hypothetical protein
MRTRAFTLFEIAISLVILTVAVVSTALVFPVGIKAQQLARQRIYATNLALGLMDAWTQQAQTNHNRQVEAQYLSGNTFVHRSREDIERTLMEFNLRPLPPTIAARLDSDNDEIQTLLNQGSRIYYPSSSLSMPQSILIAVSGYAQNNALPHHPCISWPYMDHVPGPPHHWEADSWHLNAGSWPSVTEFDALYAAFNSDDFPSSPPDAAAYMVKAQALVTSVAAALSMPTVMTAGGIAPKMPDPLPATWADGDKMAFPHPAWVWAVSHLAHAAASKTAPGVPNAALTTTTDYAKQTFDAAVAWAMRYVSTDPYDWGMARDAGHQSGWDYPLTQFDIVESSGYPKFLASTVAGGDARWSEDVSWRVVSRSPVKNNGQARGFQGWHIQIPPNKAQIDTSWGNPDHFTLTRAFQPCERARQLVFFSVDWQAYDDFEEASPGLQDSAFGIFDSQGVMIGSEAYGLFYAERFASFADADHSRVANGRIDCHIEYFDEPAANQTDRKAFMLGIHGADRNGSGAFERGPVPKSVRMKAIVISRFNFYDRILPFSSRG